MRNATVAIVGRPNVGKSTIFNRLAGDRISIIEDVPGVTRDRIYAQAHWLETTFHVIDTGGIQVTDEPLSNQIRMQAEIAIDEADVIIFVVNGREGITATDESVAKLLYQADKPVVLAVNKIDVPHLRDHIYTFYSLGFGDPFPVSGAHGIGLGDLLEEVTSLFPEEPEEDIQEDHIYFSVIGRPNVGKSSLVNAILDEERVIVSEIEGTTREAVDTTFERGEQNYVMTDTAGIRKRGKVYEATEKYSVLRALKAIDRSDVVLVLLDAETGIREQDKRVAGYAHEAGRAVIIVVNKWDLMDKHAEVKEEFEAAVRFHFQFLEYAPIIFISAKTKLGLQHVLPLVTVASQNHAKRISTSVLNDVITDALTMNPPPTVRGKPLKIFYAAQVAVKPPGFAFFVNNPKLMHFSYKRFLENVIRESFGYTATPLNIYVRQRQ